MSVKQNGNFIVVATENKIYCYESESLKIRWEVETTRNLNGTNVPPIKIIFRDLCHKHEKR